MIRGLLDRKEIRGRKGGGEAARIELPPSGVDTALASLNVQATMRLIDAIYVFASICRPNQATGTAQLRYCHS